jgi:hypothetical protein
MSRACPAGAPPGSQVELGAMTAMLVERIEPIPFGAAPD